MADQTKKELRNKLMYQVFVRNYTEEGTFDGVRRDLDRIREVLLMPSAITARSTRSTELWMISGR